MRQALGSTHDESSSRSKGLFQGQCYYFELNDAAWGCHPHQSAQWPHHQTSYDEGLGG
jgi:hypothetical protein